MTAGDRDLVASIRAELAAIAPGRACDRTAESAGLGTDLAAREVSIARLAVRLGREPVKAGQLLAAGRRAKHVRVLESAGGTIPFDWSKAADHCRIAYLRGRFLARGSLSLAAGRMHLEFVVSPDEGPLLAGQLAEITGPASVRLRRGRAVVTWKRMETIVTFLRRIGAGPAVLEVENRQVSRAVRGEINRVINAESANLQRAVVAAGRQLAAIDRLESDDRLARLSATVRMVAAGRTATPEATLGELAARLALHRSTVQRALELLERLAEQEDGEALRSGRRGRGSATHRDHPPGPPAGPSAGPHVRGLRSGMIRP